MTIDQMEMIEAIVNTGSFIGASKLLHKSQPAISTGIKKVEDEYGVQIFSRENYRPTLTTQGEAIYKGAMETLFAFRRLHCHAKELGEGMEASLHLSLDPALGSDILDTFFQYFCDLKVTCELKITTQILFEGSRSVLDGDVDLALGSIQADKDLQDLRYVPVGSCKLIPCIHKNLLGNRVLSAETLSLIPHVIVSHNIEDKTKTQSQANNWIVDEHHLKERLVLNGKAWGKISEEIVAKNTDLQIIGKQILPHLHLDFYLMRHRHRPLGKIAQQLWNKYSI